MVTINSVTKTEIAAPYSENIVVNTINIKILTQPDWINIFENNLAYPNGSSVCIPYILLILIKKEQVLIFLKY